VENRAAFIAAFQGLGYRVCDNSRIELGFEKVALYELLGSPKHMARQLHDGTWTSKCGGSEDITHYTLDALDSNSYGAAVLYMKRFILISWIVRFFQGLEWRIESVWPYLRFLVWRRRQ